LELLNYLRKEKIMYTGPVIDLHCHVGEEKEGIKGRPGCEDWWIGPSVEATMFMQKARGWFAKHKKDPKAMDMDIFPISLWKP